ncbi:hypothetical protein KFE98_04455 [bacterium SCSIO 12741]|nr:hypothetical protein KFE98_04455 [bacterium SCSIO 12741]
MHIALQERSRIPAILLFIIASVTTALALFWVDAGVHSSYPISQPGNVYGVLINAVSLIFCQLLVYRSIRPFLTMAHSRMIAVSFGVPLGFFLVILLFYFF